ncbi:tol-pal system protein YbgF [Prosthecomicrobium pneumaticum]|uniref:Cell division coordinator CpoB n=1 Tax=Prosthecomicrobium pneumaticum TaxID=81895 RepID=A0A7W9CVD9_9HYPH|nr:tol-pal system protein YbgF [Prosthecomicrobium pneumaticum]MBB5752600.1 tol-pal system protein YbgF [Prosthecomicrobium pneumaticum]
MKRSIVFLAAGFVALATFAGTADAGLFDRLRGRDGQPPQDVGSAPAAQSSSSAEAQFTLRIERVEDQMRLLTGQVEELQHQVRQLQDQLKRQQDDVEFRLQQLEGGGAARPPQRRGEAPAHTPAAPPRAEAAASAPPRTAAAPTPAQGDAIGSVIDGGPGSGDDLGLEPVAPGGPGTPPRDLGTLTLDPNAAPPADAGGPIDLSALGAGAAAQPVRPEAPAPTGNARGDYENAYNLVLSGDYALAETSFRTFLASYPDDGLAGDAQYWLGESLYQRGELRDAADEFLTGYKRYPQSDKAPDMLLKLGLSLAGLNQRDAACATYAQTLKQYPKATRALVDRVQAEQKRASC